MRPGLGGLRGWMQFTDLCPGPVRRPPFPKASVVSSQVLGIGELGLLVGEQVWGSL